MAISQEKLLQLLRSSVVYGSKAEAKAAVKADAFAGKNFDGTPVAVRYTDAAGKVQSLFVIYHQNVNGETGWTIFDSVQTLNDAIASDDNTVVITADTTGENIDLSVNVDGKTIVKNTTEGDDFGKLSTAVKIQYVAAVPASEGQVAVPAHIALMDNTNTPLSTINVSDLIGNGQLEGTSYDKTTGILTLTFKTADGGTEDVEIDLKEMLDIDDVVIGDDSDDYLHVTLGGAGETGENMILDVKLSPLTTTSEEGTVSRVENVTPGLADSVDVKKYVDLLAADSISGVVVNKVSATVENNVATVEIFGTDMKVASAETGYVATEFPEDWVSGNTAVSSTSTVAEALKALESNEATIEQTILDNEEVTSAAIKALAEAGGVLDTEGVIVYTTHTTDRILSSATNLDEADVALAQAIEALEDKQEKVTVTGSECVEVTSVETKNAKNEVISTDYTVNLNHTKDGAATGAAGLYDKEVSGKTTLDVSFDFGTFEF